MKTVPRRNTVETNEQSSCPRQFKSSAWRLLRIFGLQKYGGKGLIEYWFDHRTPLSEIRHTTDTKIHLLQAFSLRIELPIHFSGALPRPLLFQAFSLFLPAT
jgi:hypothetical protein